MHPTVLFSLLFSIALCCPSILPTRFDAHGDAWVHLPQGIELHSYTESCSMELARGILGCKDEETRAVYMLRGHMVIVQKKEYVNGDVDFYKMPKNDTEGQDPRFNEALRKRYRTGLRINAHTLHGAGSRLISPINRGIEIVADDAGRSGIPNFRSISCYLNTAIQLLYLIPTFRHQLADAVNRYGPPSETISYTLNAVFAELEKGKQPGTELTQGIIDSLSLEHKGFIVDGYYQQYDSAEALKYIIQDIEGEISQYLPIGSVWFFRDLLYTRHVRVDTANGSSTSAVLDAIGLDLYAIDDDDIDNGVEITMEKLLADTYAETTIRNHHHRHVILDLPTYMFVKFPRFAVKGRIQNSISLPVVTNLHKVLTDKSLDPNMYDYELIGVGLHEGEHSNSGHYTSMVRGDDGEWRIMDDSAVSLAGNRAPQGATLSSNKVTVALYRRVLKSPEHFTNKPLPNRFRLDFINAGLKTPLNERTGSEKKPGADTTTVTPPITEPVKKGTEPITSEKPTPDKPTEKPKYPSKDGNPDPIKGETPTPEKSKDKTPSTEKDTSNTGGTPKTTGKTTPKPNTGGKTPPSTTTTPPSTTITTPSTTTTITNYGGGGNNGGSGRNSGGGGSSKTSSTAPAPKAVVQPRKIPCSGVALSVSKALVAAAILALPILYI